MLSFKACAVGALGLSCAVMGISTQAGAQQILSAVESRKPGGDAPSFDLEPRDAQVSAQAGQLLSTTFGGADSRALTDYGVNKVYSRGTSTHRQYATSNWMDSYTVSGAAGTMVDVSFTFSIDGNIDVFDAFDGANAKATVNYNVYALRGANWSLGGYNMGDFIDRTRQIRPSGDVYGALYATSTATDATGQFYQFSPDYFSTNEPSLGRQGGVYRYQNNNGTPGNGNGSLWYDEATQTYTTYRTMNLSNGVVRQIFTTFTSTGSQDTIDGVLGVFRPYSPQLLTTAWDNFNRFYPVLDVVRLCDNPFGFCTTGDYPGTDLTVSFSVAAGSSFTLLSSLHSADLYDEGPVDFFSTAKVTGVFVSPGAELTSASGALTALSDGSYGYQAALGVVPEPESWAMMIAGFGLVGASMRRRRRGAEGLARI